MDAAQKAFKLYFVIHCYKAMDDKINKHIQNQTYKPNTNMNFYHRVVNKTNITFSNDELGLLNKDLKYNLSKKRKQWISNLAMEAETAVTLLPPGEQDYICHQVAKNIKRKCTNNKIEVVHTMTYKERRETHETNRKQVKSGSLNFLEPYGPAQACNGTALPLPLHHTDQPTLYMSCTKKQ